MLATLLQDIRYGLRMLVRSPGFTVVAALSLALGIGANTAIFTLIDAVLLKSLPVQNPQELVNLRWAAKAWPEPYATSMNGSSWPEGGGMVGTSLSYRTFEEFRFRNQVFSGMLGFATLGRVNVMVQGEAGLAQGQLVSGDYFSSLGLTPFVGRLLTMDDDRPGAAPVAVISHGLWQRRFGGDRAVAGKLVTINGAAFTIAGVTPPEFFGLSPGAAIEVSIPLAAQPQVAPERGTALFTTPTNWWLLMMGRLKPGVTVEQARSGLDVIFQQSVTEGVVFTPGKPVVKPSLQIVSGGQGLDSLRRQFSQPLFILMSVVGVVLLIACANVANLLLARAAARQKEIAVRLSLGASRARLVAQLLTESLLLAALGGLAGLVLAQWGSRLLVAMMQRGNNPVVLNLTPDLNVLAFTAGACLLTGLLFGLAPAFRTTRVDLTPALKSATGTGGGRLRLGLSKTLVVAQVALSLVLLFGAGLFVRTLVNLSTMDIGFDRNNLLLFGVNAPQAGYKGIRLGDFYSQVERGLQSLPGVTSATMSAHRLLSGGMRSSGILVPGYSAPDGKTPSVAVLHVSPSFFDTMRIPLLLGRGLDPQDDENRPKVAIVNQSFVRKFFPGEQPVGRTFTFSRREGKNPSIEIVGVVKDARYNNLRRDQPAILYLPVRQDLEGIGSMNFEIRTSGDPKAVIPAARAVVDSLDKRIPLFDVKTQTEQIDELLLQERLFAKLTTFFSVLALLLACVGLYGILSYAVLRRTGEIGIRMALGAQRGNILRMVLRETLLLVGIGVTLGVPVAWAIAKLASSQVAAMLFGLNSTDIPTIAGAAALMALVAAIAGFLPARRASQVHPMVALRYE